VTASLSGAGLPAGNIVLSPTSLAFGSSVIGTHTAAQNLTISNTGGVSITLQTPVTTGDFPITANTCGTSLAPNSGCTISIAFNPTAAGGRAGVFTISDDAGTQTAQLSGNGQAAATAILSGASLNFSQPQTVGTKSGPQQVTLTNNGDISLTDIAISVTGDFTAQNNCGSFLVGHASCAVSVNFVPTKVGAGTGVLTVNTELGAQTVALSGTGLASPGFSALPATLNFGGQAVNSTSATQRVVVTNSGGSPLAGLTFSVTGDYAIAGTNCPSGQTLNAQGNCYIDITFTPSQAGERSGLLTVGATNLSSPLDVAMAGTGVDFQLIVTGSSSAVIVSGQTATYAIQVVPVNGSAGTLTMGCTGVPQNATCALNPATLPIASGVTGYATVTVASGTTTTSSATPVNPWRRTGVTFAALMPFLLLGCRKRRTQARGWFVCFLSLSLGIVLFIPTACGTAATGGGKTTSPTPPQGPTTPSGVYTLNITASMPGLQRSVPVTLTIQ
jgi:Abnormal spindle-like microcephaly-assoc'd, ASPM-SPD-2-Hydin